MSRYKKIKINNMGTSGDMAMNAQVNPRWENERYLLEFIREKLNITDEDMTSISTVKSKVRGSKINEVLSN